MRKAVLYPRLAAQSMRRNKRLYVPCLLTCIFAVAMFYNMLFLYNNDGIYAIRGSDTVRMLLYFGAVTVAIFSAIVLFYTDSFLIKSRKRELGLYSILGMEKRHIAYVMFFETVYCTLIGIAGGIAAGVLLSKLFCLALCAIIQAGVPFGFSVSASSVFVTVAVFGAIFLITLAANLVSVGKTKAVELLHSESAGEREPKTKWLMTLVGTVTTAAGYIISFKVGNPQEAILLFFIAVILVIIGTYCLFTAGIIALLKLLRKNKKCYYKTKNFISTSGMLYRMKKNAAGLASICILCTMVLVTVSTTQCLYMGTVENFEKAYPYDIEVRFRAAGDGTPEAALDAARSLAADEGFAASLTEWGERIEFYTDGKAEDISPLPFYAGPDDMCVYIITDDELSKRTGRVYNVKDGEAVAGMINGCCFDAETVSILGTEYKTEILDNFPARGNIITSGVHSYCFAVNAKTFEKIKSSVDTDMYYASVGINGGELAGDAELFAEKLQESLRMQKLEFGMMQIKLASGEREYFFAMYGGFFFIGLLLGSLFLAATVMIIYYKQVSEGFEDRARFKILQQVGMTPEEVKHTIRKQVLTVFFLPIIVSGIHTAGAFSMIKQILTAFGMADTALFVICCLASYAVFALIYVAIYAITAKAYYRIVKN